MAESVLNHYDEIKIFNLGSNLPVSDFVQLSEKISPDIIFISMVYGIRKGCGFFDVIFGFWFFAYVRTRN